MSRRTLKQNATQKSYSNQKEIVLKI